MILLEKVITFISLAALVQILCAENQLDKTLWPPHTWHPHPPPVSHSTIDFVFILLTSWKTSQAHSGLAMEECDGVWFYLKACQSPPYMSDPNVWEEPTWGPLFTAPAHVLWTSNISMHKVTYSGPLCWQNIDKSAAHFADKLQFKPHDSGRGGTGMPGSMMKMLHCYQGKLQSRCHYLGATSSHSGGATVACKVCRRNNCLLTLGSLDLNPLFWIANAKLGFFSQESSVFSCSPMPFYSRSKHQSGNYSKGVHACPLVSWQWQWSPLRGIIGKIAEEEKGDLSVVLGRIVCPQIMSFPKIQKVALFENMAISGIISQVKMWS